MRIIVSQPSRLLAEAVVVADHHQLVRQRQRERQPVSVRTFCCVYTIDFTGRDDQLHFLTQSNPIQLTNFPFPSSFSNGFQTFFLSPSHLDAHMIHFIRIESNRIEIKNSYTPFQLNRISNLKNTTNSIFHE